MVGDVVEYLCTRRPGLWVLLGVTTANGAVYLLATLCGWHEVLAWYQMYGPHIGFGGLCFALGYTTRRLQRERRHRRRRAQRRAVVGGPIADDPHYI